MSSNFEFFQHVSSWTIMHQLLLIRFDKRHVLSSATILLTVIHLQEKLELAKLEHAPMPMEESVEEPMAKINVLLQAYI